MNPDATWTAGYGEDRRGVVPDAASGQPDVALHGFDGLEEFEQPFRPQLGSVKVARSEHCGQLHARARRRAPKDRRYDLISPFGNTIEELQRSILPWGSRAARRQAAAARRFGCSIALAVPAFQLISADALLFCSPLLSLPHAVDNVARGLHATSAAPRSNATPVAVARRAFLPPQLLAAGHLRRWRRRMVRRLRLHRQAHPADRGDKGVVGDLTNYKEEVEVRPRHAARRCRPQRAADVRSARARSTRT